MKITGVKGYHLALPKHSTTIIGGLNDYEGRLYRDVGDEEVRGWTGQSPHFANVMTYLVQIFTDEGIVGYGEVESLYGARGMLRLAGENLLGADPFDVQHIMNEILLGSGNTLRVEAVHPQLPLVKEHLGVEFALWDIIGKKVGQPVCQLLGGKVRRRAAVSLFVGQKGIDQCLADIDRAVKEGIRTVKLKAGANDRRDVELLREVRRQFGWDLIVRVDPNGAWGDVCDAVRILKQMAPYNLQYIEGCLSRGDGESYRRLREMTGVPICMCGEFNGPMQMRARDALAKLADLVRLDAIDVLSVEPSRTGGILGFTQVAAFCEGAGIEVVTHRARGGFMQSCWLNAVITAYSASYAHDIVPFGQPSSIAADIICEPLVHSGGFMEPPAGPGWGVEPDWENIQKYCVGTEEAGEVA